MSAAELNKARKQLNDVRSLVKQDKLMPAVQSLHSALGIMMRTALMKSERMELEDLVRDAVAWLSNEPKIKKIFPLSIEYKPGEESTIYETLQELLEILSDQMAEDASQKADDLLEKRRAMLDEAQKFLIEKELAKAQEVHGKLVKEFGNDPVLLEEIGEQYLSAQYYEESLDYFSRALEANPESIKLYNRIAISLRKLSRFDVAEKYYLKAFEIAPEDVGLMFNAARLYMEWESWAKAESMAKKIVEMAPSFAEGAKLLAYIEKHKK